MFGRLLVLPVRVRDLPAVLHRTVERVRASLRTLRGRAWARRLQLGLQIGVAALLLARLTQVGWGRLFDALPASPLFYLCVVAAWAGLPASEALIYRPLWGTALRRMFAVAARKRAFNDDVGGYSGEALLVVWAATEGVDEGRALRAVRDNNILSASTSLVVTLAAAAGAAATGVFGGAVSGQLLALAVLPIAGLGVALAVLRRRMFALSVRQTVRISAIHLTRLMATSGLAIAAWAVAVPVVPMEIWVAFLATQLLVNRIPFLPGRDLLFVGAGVELAGALELAEAAVAGALLVQVTTYKVLNLAALLLTARMKPAQPGEAGAATISSSTST
jgi:hypothetical protein